MRLASLVTSQQPKTMSKSQDKTYTVDSYLALSRSDRLPPNPLIIDDDAKNLRLRIYRPYEPPSISLSEIEQVRNCKEQIDEPECVKSATGFACSSSLERLMLAIAWSVAPLPLYSPECVESATSPQNHRHAILTRYGQSSCNSLRSLRNSNSSLRSSARFARRSTVTK